MPARDNPVLRALGERLRELRGERGLGLAELALRSGLSRRFLTEAEAGRANPSLQSLARLAEALEVELPDLLRRPPRTYRGGRVALVGLRGAGKTSVGRRLAQELEAPFVELDQRVEALAGMELGALFALHGEEHFHQLEAEALEAVLAEGDHLVLATGGSIVAVPSTFERLLRTCRTVWLEATPQEHFQRVLDQGDRRPMQDRPRAMEELRAILDRRRPLYARCELAVETSGRTVEEVAREVLRALSAADSGAPGAP